MIIKVPRAQAVDALLRGETLWSATTGEGWELDLSCPCWRSKREVRRFLSRLHKYNDKPHEFVVHR